MNRRGAPSWIPVLAAALALGAPAAAHAQAPPNSGLPGSACVPAEVQPGVSERPAGWIADPLGPDAPAPNEGDALDGHARGLSLLLHGGAWFVTGHAALESTRPMAGFWRERGWRTVAASYRGCEHSIRDVVWIVDRLHALRPELPICITGISAGAHLAVVAAARRPEAVSCVIGLGTVADPAAALHQTVTSGGRTVVADWLYHFVVAAFGPAGVASATPDPAQIRARLLLGKAETDAVVPWEQSADLRDRVLAARPGADVEAVRLAGGDLPWVHGKVSLEAMLDFSERMVALVERTERPPAPAPDPPGPAFPPPTAPPATPSTPPAPAPAPPAAPPATPGGAAGTTAAPARKGTVRVSRARGRVVVAVRPVRRGKVRLRLRAGRRTLARATRTLRANRTTKVRLRLPRARPRRATLTVSGAGLAVRRVVRLR